MHRTRNKLLSLALSLVMLLSLLPAMSLTASAAPSSVTLTKSDGAQVVLSSNTTETDYAYDSATATLTLTNFTGKAVSADGDLTIHLEGSNTLTMLDAGLEAYGIKITSGSATITADAGASLTIVNTALTKEAYGIKTYSGLKLNSGSVTVNIKSSADVYGVYPKAKLADSTKLDVTAESTGGDAYGVTDSTGYKDYGIQDMSRKSNVVLNVRVKSAEGKKALAVSKLLVSGSSAKITLKADNGSGPLEKRTAIKYLTKLDFNAAGSFLHVEKGYVGQESNHNSSTETNVYYTNFYLTDFGKNTVSTIPADNQVLQLHKGAPLGYGVLCNAAGEPLDRCKFVYQSAEAPLQWVGGSHFDLKAGHVRDGISDLSNQADGGNYHNLCGGVRGGSRSYDFQIVSGSGSLPEGLSLELGRIYGTATTPCAPGSVEIKITDSADRSKTTTFTLHYGAITPSTRTLTVGDAEAFNMSGDSSGTGWSYTAATKSLTLDGYNGGPIVTEDALNIYVINNDATITVTESSPIGIYAKYGDPVSLHTNGKMLNITDGAATVDTPKGIACGALTLAGAKVNIDISAAKGFAYGIHALSSNVTVQDDTQNELTVKVKLTGENGGIHGVLPGIEMKSNTKLNIEVENQTDGRDTVGIGYYSGEYGVAIADGATDVEVNVTAKGKQHVAAAGLLDVPNASAKITLSADNNGGEQNYREAVTDLQRLNLTQSSDFLQVNKGLVKHRSSSGVTSFGDRTVSTNPAGNQFIQRSGILCAVDGTTLDACRFEYTATPVGLTWIGGSSYDLSAGHVGDKVGELIAGSTNPDAVLQLIGGIKGSESCTFVIISGSLPAGLTMSEGGEISGTTTAVCEAGSVEIKATDTTNASKHVTFTIHYGAITQIIPVTGLALDKTELVLNQNTNGTATATVTPTDATDTTVDVTASTDNTVVYQYDVTKSGPVNGKTTFTIPAKNKAGKTVLTMSASSLTRTVTVYVLEETPNAQVDSTKEYIDGLYINTTYTINGTPFRSDEHGHIAIRSGWYGTTVSIVRPNAVPRCNSAAQSLAIPNKDSGGSIGGGGGALTYDVTIDKTANGSITASAKSASKGDAVTLTVTPDKGYALDALTVLDQDGKEVKLTEKDGKYTFTMPAGKVTVKGSFAKLAPTFSDVPADAWYAEAVKWAAEKEITGGIGGGLFGPNEPCTRAQIVTFLWRAASSPEPKAASSFADVTAGSYYAKAVAWAVENGITTGVGGSSFAPDLPCDRAQAVTFLFRALSAKAAGKAEFSDVPAGSYYADAVAWAAANGVTTGVGGDKFAPTDGCTRAQIVTFLYRAYNK